MINEKQDVILPWVELQDLLMYFHTIGDEKATAMLRNLTPVQSYGVVTKEDMGDALRLAFMHGAKWWEFHSTKGTMWQSDQKLVAEAAERRYHGSIMELPAPTQQPEARGVDRSTDLWDEIYNYVADCECGNRGPSETTDLIIEIAHLQQAPQDYHDIPDDQLIGILTARWKMKSDFKAYAGPFISAMQAQAPQGVGEAQGMLFQHGETGKTTFVSIKDADRFQNDNPRWVRVCPLYRHPAPVKVDDHE